MKILIVVDFYMSEEQQEHALVVERLAPRLAALRIELCPCHMSESYFWKVYFVLLHSRLNKQDSEVLSTPRVSFMAVCFGFHADVLNEVILNRCLDIYIYNCWYTLDRS